MSEAEIEIIENADESRYEILVGGEPAGLVAYRRKPGQIALTHTEIGDEFGGQGLGGKLIATVIERERGENSILPYCPFVKAHIRKHPDLVGVVPVELRGEFDLADL